MSRHTILSKNPNHEVVIGWDRALENFFAVIEEDGVVLEWISGESTPENVARRLTPWADVPSSVLSLLHLERESDEVNSFVDHRTNPDADRPL